MKKYLLTSLVVYIAWSVMDFLIHGLALKSTYEATALLWRPLADMKMGLIYLVTAISALAFTGIYSSLVKSGSVSTGLKYGLLFGIATGFGMGFGTYAMTPIPYSLAWSWTLGHIAETLVGGAIVGAMIKKA